MPLWKVPEPNQALLVSGSKSENGFKVIRGRAFVWPVIERARFLSLDLHETPLEVKCVTKQGIPVVAKGVAAFKVANDEQSIVTAARAFLDKQQLMDSQAHMIFTGHLRAIIGNMTVEDLISNREVLERETRESSAAEMQGLGLSLESLKIQELDDPTNYIANLAKPHLAEAERNARIAQANNNQQAAKVEAETQAQVAEAQKEAAKKQAGYTAEVQKAQAEAAQAGPLAEAQAEQSVVEQRTRLAEVEAARKDKELDATVRKPADAAKYQQIAQAEGAKEQAILEAQANAERVKLAAGAQAEQTRSVGQAEADAVKARGMAEGTALKAKAEGLQANNDAVIGQQLVGQIPDIIKAAASAFDNVDSMTVLNGADGVMESMSTIIAKGMGVYGTLRTAMEAQKTEPDAPANGHKEALIGPSR